MILETDHWHFGYEQILNDCRAGDDPGSALLLCNADVDAMAAARILSFMLRSDGIHYQLLPCTCVSSLEKTLGEIQLTDVRAVVLLNFGAARNLTTLFDSGICSPEIKVYVMDCRKPVHLANIYAGENIVVFMDHVQGDDLPSDGDNLSGDDSSSSEEEDSDDDSESDDSSLDEEDEDEEEASFDDVVGEQQLEAKPDLNEDTSYDAEPEDDNAETATRQRPREDDEASQDSSGNKRRKRDDPDGMTDVEQSDADSPEKDAPPVVNPRELHRQRRDRLRSYYSEGSFFGTPAAYISYQLAMQLRFGDQSDLLWLACVGVTDAYLHARLDLSGYSALTLELKRLCLRLFPDDMYERVSNTVYAEDLLGGSSEDRTKITFSDNGRILAEKDYRFFLLRHSSLYESMVFSNYISTKLQVWTKKGTHKLQELLAKMGYPLEECKQPFAFMKPVLRRRLQEKLTENSQDYNLGNCEYSSFFRVTGYQSLLSASDTSYAVTALLECEAPGSSDEQADEEKQLIESFNIALDALNSNMAPGSNIGGLGSEGRDASSLVNGGSLSGNSGIGAGIRLAMSLQKTIIQTAVGLVDRGAISRLRHFRYAYLNCTSAGENQTARADLIRTSNKSTPNDEAKHHIFAKPLALSRLAHYLMDMHRESQKWTGAKSRPLVLLAEKPLTGTYLVVGYEYPERAGNFLKNRFGQNFELTAKSMNGTFKFDSFDSNVVEVNGDDVQRFIEQLHYLMDSI